MRAKVCIAAIVWTFAMPIHAVDSVYADAFNDLVAPLPPSIAALTARLVVLVAAHLGLSGKVMTGWKSVNLRHGAAGHVCSVFPHQGRVSLYFERGRLLEQGDELLMGDGLKKRRYLRLAADDAIQIDAIGILLSEAIALFA
ncbi:MAG: DUF1801 domain-containing protein [Candidatus Devosia euplotis]|nr:DUF1801 domain-containing protein [Candidatus Devosia euplotis]